MKIYLLRHGETDWNKAGRLQGHTDIPMNENGIEQISRAGEFFAREVKHIDVIISSPLVRALKSAEIIADKIGYKKENIIVEPNFIERSFGYREGLTKEEQESLTEKEKDYRISDKGYAETVEDICRRGGAAIKKYVEKYWGKTILIIAHGSILKAVLTSATKGKFSFSEGVAIFGAGELYILEYDGNIFTVISPQNS